MAGVVAFVQAHRPYFEVLQALTIIINLLVWLVALALLGVSLRHRRIESLAVGPFNFRIRKEEAIVAAATASRAWQSPVAEGVDVPRIRATIERVFTPATLDNFTGKAILWVDDQPANNMLVMRALRKFGLDIEQATSTTAALDAIARRKFDLVISDMARPEDPHAGYSLLKTLREGGSTVPYSSPAWTAPSTAARPPRWAPSCPPTT